MDLINQFYTKWSFTLHKNFIKLLSLKAEIYITLGALIVLAVILYYLGRNKRQFTTKVLSYSAICISLAFILSYVKLAQNPQGGSITLASMLPIFIVAYIGGPSVGILTGLCYGMLQFLQDGTQYIVSPIQLIIDYPLAFSMLGLAGFFRNKPMAGALVGGLARLVCHFFSGVVFFASYAGKSNVFLYSLIYNSSFLLPDLAICLIVLAIPAVRRALVPKNNDLLKVHV